MNYFLEAWVREIYYLILHSDDQEADSTTEELLFGVASMLLDCPASSQHIRAGMRELYVLPEDIKVLSDDFIAMLLFHSVSECCVHRAESVGAIMGMSEDAQLSLMEIIQSHMTRKDEIVMSATLIREEEAQNERDMPPEDVNEPPLVANFLDRAIEHFEDVSCSRCLSCMEELSRLQSEVGRQLGLHRTEVNELKQRLAAASHTLEDSEVTLLEKDRIIFQLQQQQGEHEGRVKEMERLSTQLVATQTTLGALEDECDVLRPQAAKLQALETSMAKMRERLEELSEVKQQLRAEVAGHQESYSKLVTAEQEVSELKQLKPQIEQYRLELAEALISNEGYLNRLEQQSQQLCQLEEENAGLKGGHEAQLKAQHSLIEELQAASEERRQQSRSQGIGEGISELNPALMQELHRLRVENTELSSRLHKCSTEALTRLEKEIADVKCINSSLQQKWTRTKELLEAAEKRIAALECALRNEQFAGAEWQVRLQETASLTHEESSQRKHAYRRMQAHLERRGEARVELLQLGDGLKRRLDAEDNEQQQKRLCSAHSQQIQSKEEEHSQIIAALKQECEQRIAYEGQRAVSLSAELEDELQKRRRVDRLKRMLETEVQRLKVQLSGVGGNAGDGSGQVQGDIGLAAKELRGMQEQLDAQQLEITSLRQQLAQIGSIRNSNSNSNSNDGAASNDKGMVPSHERAERNAGSVLHSKAVRMGAQGSVGTLTNSRVQNHQAGSQQSSIQSFIEQTELNDKRVEQLSREKREILSKSLEDSKEKLELSQKLIGMDKENSILKTELRKIRLEKERLERKVLKTLSESALNVMNVDSQQI
jgi:hypothetical protein